jgi:hypothetical protein
LLEKNVATRLRPDRDDMSVDCFKVCTYSLAVWCRND